ncbi:hypothetical protein VNO77_27471 [Canavalia gladiata]|uniref:Uncharacterized protein n=1 Tax=Canavalia gladiata TaxID=3824 RepID=A0AAN9KUR3_CANGL
MIIKSRPSWVSSVFSRSGASIVWERAWVRDGEPIMVATGCLCGLMLSLVSEGGHLHVLQWLSARKRVPRRRIGAWVRVLVISEQRLHLLQWLFVRKRVPRWEPTLERAGLQAREWLGHFTAVMATRGRSEMRD